MTTNFVSTIQTYEFTQQDFTYDGELRVGTWAEFEEFVKNMEFDNSVCATEGCSNSIGFGLAYDSRTGGDMATFNLFMLVRVGKNPVVALCDECAETIRLVTFTTGLVL